MSNSESMPHHRCLRPRRLRSILLALTLMFASTVTNPAPAQAALSVVNAATSLYDCTDGRAICTAKRVTVPSGSHARMICWEEGRSVGFPDNYWFYVKLVSGGEGFIKAERLDGQTPVPSCRFPAENEKTNEIRGVMAAQWALDHDDEFDVTDDEAELISAVFDQPANHTEGDWSGDCISFAGLAWYSAGKVINFDNAVDVAGTYTLSKSKTPPRGALVFWNWAPFGHVAISLGNGRVIGTQGSESNYLPIADKSISSGGYLGWAMP